MGGNALAFSDPNGLAAHAVAPVAMALTAVIVGYAISPGFRSLVNNTARQCFGAIERMFSESNDDASVGSPNINSQDTAEKTPDEIDRLSIDRGLQPKGPDPRNGIGAYVDPITGEQRVLVHPNDPCPHCHVNDPQGNRLDINGNIVSPESPSAHLPLRRPK